MEDFGQTKGTKINYAGKILDRVDYSQYLAADSFSKGDLEGCFFNCKNIFHYLVGKFDDGEIKELEQLEKKINLFLYKKRSERANKALCRLIEKYWAMLQRLIEEKKMGLVDKEDETLFA